MASFTAGVVNPLVAGLVTTSNTNAPDGYQNWVKEWQSLQGMWRRVWVYKTDPTYVSSTQSGAPEVDFTYVDVFVDVKTNRSIDWANYSATNQTKHSIEYDSDSDTDGWGVEGTFWTTVPGQILRVKADGDVEANCSQTFNVQVGELAGDYTPSYDTSSQLPGQFFNDVVLGAVAQCPDFNAGLVDM